MADTLANDTRPVATDDVPPQIRSAVKTADQILKDEIGVDPALPYQVEWSYFVRPEGFGLQLILSCLGWHVVWRRPLTDFNDEAGLRRSFRDAIDRLLRRTSEELGKDIRQRLASLDTPDDTED
jgi:hypothetical protein